MNTELLQKHIEFEMNLISSENLKTTIHTEIDFFVDRISQKKLAQVVSPQTLEKVSLHYLNQLEIGSGIIDLTRQGIEESLRFFSEDSGSASSYIDKDSFFRVVRSLVEFKEIRNSIIHFSVHSAAYSRMISNIIYAAIKDFLVTENPIAKNPLGGSFLKFGQDILNSLPGMEGNFDKKITEFIGKNLSGRIQQSEAHIKNELDSGKTEEILEELWTFLQGVPLSNSQNVVPTANLISILDTIPGFWDHLKKTGFLERYVSSGIRSFYKEYSEFTMEELGKKIGLEKAHLVEELSDSSYQFLNTDDFRDYYRQVLTRRLGAFYATL